jgi:hypothetical protein
VRAAYWWTKIARTAWWVANRADHFARLCEVRASLANLADINRSRKDIS